MRRPSWRCPHCNQNVCYTDIRVDQNMVKASSCGVGFAIWLFSISYDDQVFVYLLCFVFQVLREVGDNVNDVIISADGSWKAVLESDDCVVQTSERTLNCQKERPEQRESTTSSAALPIVLDLTASDDEMDAVGISDIEDRKPFQVTLQSQPVSLQLNNANAVNQNVATQDDYWSSVFFNHGSMASGVRSDVQMVNGISEPTPANNMTSPVITDAISPALNRDVGGRGNTNLNSGMQNQFSASSNLQLQQSQLVNSIVNNEYGRLTQIPRHVSRTPIAVQALPVPSQTPAPQHSSRTNLGAVIPNGSFTSQGSPSMVPTPNGFNSVSGDMDRQQQFSRSHNMASSSLQHHSTVQVRFISFALLLRVRLVNAFGCH